MIKFSNLFSRILDSHLKSEIEVHIKNGAFTQDSFTIMNKFKVEMHCLKYRTHIKEIYRKICLILSGQPIEPGVENSIHDIVPEVIYCFEKYIICIQKKVVLQDFHLDNIRCTDLCQNSKKINNFTSQEISNKLTSLLDFGTNFVPTIAQPESIIIQLIESDLKTEAIRSFRQKNTNYPMLQKDSNLKNVILCLLQQSPSNTTETKLYCEIYENYVASITSYLNNLDLSQLKNFDNIKSLIPKDTVLTISDKGLGPCLLPLQWYVKQYKHQALIGGHLDTKMSEQVCLKLMLENIRKMRENFSPTERIVLKTYFKKCNPSYRVGCLKLVPKIHKIKGSINSKSWVQLPSRPIRGGEMCPINGYSIALCKMLQELHKLVKITSNSNNEDSFTFPIIHGCDEYVHTIRKINYQKENWDKITILSGDFSDAYTQSRLNDLHSSISKLGSIVNWGKEKINLGNKLSKLVFENCYFLTSNGIMQQTKGFPMGGHCSREGLDTILLSREIEICKNDNNSLLNYVRLVDDISIVVYGDFDEVKNIIGKMAKNYPESMPLNIQISCGFSRYLDVKLNKMLSLKEINEISVNLAYKEQATFNFVPCMSNISSIYQSSIIPNFMHRIFNRCTTNSSITHHLVFMMKILNHRHQSPNLIKKRYQKFMDKKQNSVNCKNSFKYKNSSLIYYDNASKSHDFVSTVLFQSYKALGQTMPPIIHRSLPKILSLLTSKRADIIKIQSYIVTNPDLDE